MHALTHDNYIVLPIAIDQKVCMLSLMREASIFEMMLQLEGRCGNHRAYKDLVAKGWVAVFVNDQWTSDVFARDALLVADSAQVGAVRAITPAGAPDMLVPDPPEAASPDAFLTVQRPGMAPRQVYIPPFRSPDDLREDLMSQGLMGKNGSLPVLMEDPIRFQSLTARVGFSCPSEQSRPLLSGMDSSDRELHVSESRSPSTQAFTNHII